MLFAFPANGKRNALTSGNAGLEPPTPLVADRETLTLGRVSGHPLWGKSTRLLRISLAIVCAIHVAGHHLLTRFGCGDCCLRSALCLLVALLQALCSGPRYRVLSPSTCPRSQRAPGGMRCPRSVRSRPSLPAPVGPKRGVRADVLRRTRGRWCVRPRLLREQCGPARLAGDRAGPRAGTLGRPPAPPAGPEPAGSQVVVQASHRYSVGRPRDSMTDHQWPQRLPLRRPQRSHWMSAGVWMRADRPHFWQCRRGGGPVSTVAGRWPARRVRRRGGVAGATGCTAGSSARGGRASVALRIRTAPCDAGRPGRG